MPRGRKKTDVAPQDLLNEVLASIEETEQKLKALRTQKKDIEKQIEAKEMAELYAIVKEKNMSIEDVKTIPIILILLRSTPRSYSPLF